jgi:fatty-acid desaturase
MHYTGTGSLLLHKCNAMYVVGRILIELLEDYFCFITIDSILLSIAHVGVVCSVCWLMNECTHKRNTKGYLKDLNSKQGALGKLM